MADHFRQPGPAEFDDAHKPKVEALAKEFRLVDVELIKKELQLQEPLFKKRSQLVSDVDGFWFQALVNCVATNVYIDDVDHEALSYLTDISVERDLEDPREATITFKFKENPFFTNEALAKKFTLKKGARELADDFSFVEDTVPQPIVIDWKSDDKNLSKLRPTIGGRDSDDFEPGSFFSTFFENTDAEVAGGIGHSILVDFFPNAIDFYLGNGNVDLDLDEDDFGSDEEDEEDDDDAEEIDLEEEENRPKKKPKSG